MDLYKDALSPEEYEAAYNALLFQYSPWPYLDDLEANRQAFNKVGQTTEFYNCLCTIFCHEYLYFLLNHTPQFLVFLASLLC